MGERTEEIAQGSRPGFNPFPILVNREGKPTMHYYFGWCWLSVEGVKKWGVLFECSETGQVRGFGYMHPEPRLTPTWYYGVPYGYFKTPAETTANGLVL